MDGSWLKHPPTGALWLVDDSLTQLERAGVYLGRRRGSGNIGLLRHAVWVYENEELWRHAPQHIDGLSRTAFRERLGTALAACQGFN